MRIRDVLLGAVLLAASAPAAPAEPWIAIVVPANDSHATLDADDVSLIFRRRKLHWADGARIQPVNLPADSPLRHRFSRAILRQSPESMEEYWNQLYFQGVLPPYVVASSESVLRFVGRTDHAIGYLDACVVDDTVRTVLLIDPESRVVAPAPVPGCPTGSP